MIYDQTFKLDSWISLYLLKVVSYWPICLRTGFKIFVFTQSDGWCWERTYTAGAVTPDLTFG